QRGGPRFRPGYRVLGGQAQQRVPAGARGADPGGPGGDARGGGVAYLLAARAGWRLGDRAGAVAPRRRSPPPLAGPPGTLVPGVTAGGAGLPRAGADAAVPRDGPGAAGRSRRGTVTGRYRSPPRACGAWLRS